MDESGQKESIAQAIKGTVIAILIVTGGIYLLMAIGSTSSRPRSAQSDFSSVPAGNQGRLRNGTSEVPIAIDEAVLPDLMRAGATYNGRVFFVAEETLVQVSEAGITATRVRILGGPQKGRLGWVPSAWVKPLN